MKQKLMNKYGRTNLNGFYYICDILENYQAPMNIINIYEELGDKYGVSSQVINRNIRTYKDTVGFSNIPNAEFVCNLMIEFENE